MHAGTRWVGGRRRGAVVVAAIAAVMGTTLLAGPAGASGACNAGTHPYGSGQARTFCGPASATVKLGTHTTVLKPGECAHTTTGFTINVGTILLGITSPTAPNYFGITLGPPAYPTPASKDGTYTQGALAFVIGHKHYAILSPTITLTGNRTKGTFSGQLLTGGTASGSFNCG